MTDYEIISIVIAIIGIMISSDLLLIALLNFLNKRNNRKK